MATVDQIRRNLRASDLLAAASNCLSALEKEPGPAEEAEIVALLLHHQLIPRACFAGAAARRGDVLSALDDALAAGGRLTSVLLDHKQPAAVGHAQAFVACWHAAAAVRAGDVQGAAEHVRRAVGLLADSPVAGEASDGPLSRGDVCHDPEHPARFIQALCLDLHRRLALPPAKAWVPMAVADAVSEMLGDPRQVVKR